MRKSLFKGAFASFIVVAAILVSCTDDYEDKTNPPIWTGNTSYAPYAIDWAEAADSVSQAFIERFYCSEPRNGSDGVFSYTPYNREGGNGNCYWQQAHAMAAMVDYYNRIKTSDPTEEARIRNYFKRWYDKRGNHYDWDNRGSTGFGNVFTDDTCWITITLLQIYDATGEQFYFDAAKKTWDESIWPRHELNQYGWLPWKLNDLGANECTNGPGSIIASMLSQYAKDAGDEAAAQEYLNQAYTCFDQNLSVMASNGTLGKTPLSYTQGTCMEAGRLIWKLTGDVAYLRKAILAARGQMTSTAMNEVYELETVARDEGPDGNNSIFHAVMFHWATRMVLDTEIDKHDAKIRKELYTYLLRHASYYWTRGIDKSEENWPNSYFGVKCYQAFQFGVDDAKDKYGPMGAYASAAQVIEGMCMLKDVKF